MLPELFPRQQDLHLTISVLETKISDNILTIIGVGITVFALVHLSTDIGTALFGVEGVNVRMPKPNP